LLALALTAWVVLQPRSRKSELAGRPPETVSPDPSEQPVVPDQQPGAVSDTAKKASQSTPSLLSANAQSEKGDVERQKDQILIAKNLAMPRVIGMLDRTPSIAVRGNRAPSETFNLISPFTTAISTDRPTFIWTPLSGATSYTISVFD